MIVGSFSFQVTIHAGPRLAKSLPLAPNPASSMRKEYSALECAVEIVEGVDDAVHHIHQNGSSHSDTIVTENGMLLTSTI